MKHVFSCLLMASVATTAMADTVKAVFVQTKDSEKAVVCLLSEEPKMTIDGAQVTLTTSDKSIAYTLSEEVTLTVGDYDPSGVADHNALTGDKTAAGQAQIFNADGMRVGAMTNSGIYIIKVGNKSIKIAVK